MLKLIRTKKEPQLSCLSWTRERWATHIWEKTPSYVFTRHVFSAAFSVAAWSRQHTQDKRLTSYHLRCVGHTTHPGRTWSHTQRSWNVLHAPACTLLSQRWLGRVHWMANGRITNDILYGKLVTGTRTISPLQRHPKAWHEVTVDIEISCQHWHDKGKIYNIKDSVLNFSNERTLSCGQYKTTKI